MKKVFYIIFYLVFVVISLAISPVIYATNYYVSATGNNSSNGLTPATAWKTVAKVNSTTFSPGDSIFFKRGETWNVIDDAALNADDNGTAVARIYYGAFGTGAKPVFTARHSIPGWNTTGNWTNLGSNRWRMAFGPYFMRRLWINGAESQIGPTSSVTSSDVWYHDNNYLYVYSISNPATAFTNMEYPGLEVANEASYIMGNYITWQNLDIRGAYFTVDIIGADYVIIDSCNIGRDAGFMGMYIEGVADHGIIRNCTFDTFCRMWCSWGDGQQTNDGLHIESANDWDIYNNTFRDWAHAMFCIRGWGSNYVTNIKFHHNFVTAPSLSYSKGIDLTGSYTHLTGTEIYSNRFYDIANENQIDGCYIKFYNNIVDYIRGVTYMYGYPGNGHGLTIYGSDVEGDNPSYNEIYNNTFVNCRDGGIVISRYGPATKEYNRIRNNLIYNCDTDGDPDNPANHYQLLMDYVVSSFGPTTWQNNLVYSTSNDQMIYYGRAAGAFDTRHLTVAEFNAYNGTGGDVISGNFVGTSASTLFVDYTNKNYRLKAGSVAISAGMNVGLATDYDGNARNLTNPCVGAFEYDSGGIPSYVNSAIEDATPSLLEMNYSMSLANIVPATSAFTVMVNSVSRTVNSVAISGAKVQLTLASAVVNGDVVTVVYTKPATNPIQTSSGGQAATISAQPVANNVSPLSPVYVSSVVENATPSLLEMTYSLTLANIVPAASAFTVRVNSLTRTVSSVAISGTSVRLTLSSAVVSGDAVTVAYTKPASNPLQTSSGGQAATITAQAVTNNVVAAIPVYVSSVVKNATPSLLEMTFSLTLANIVPASSSFTVMVNSVARTVSSVAVTGTTVGLTLASAIVFGDVITVAYTKPASNPLQTPSGGQAASLGSQSVTNLLVSPTLPVYVSSVVENATPTLLGMTYSLTLAIIVPATSAFTVMVNSVTRSVNSVTISGTIVQLTLSSPVANGDVVSVAYTKPATNPIQTSTGGQAVTISAQPVTNNVSPVSPVYVRSVVENVTPLLLEMTYSLTLANIVPAASAFTVYVNSVTRTVSSVAVSGDKVQLTLTSAVVYGDIVTVAYTKPASNPLQTSFGGQAATITAQAVTNNVNTAIPLYISSAIKNATPSLMEVTYNLSLANIIPSASSFTVIVNSIARGVNSVAVSGTTVVLTLASSVVFGDIITLAYTKPASNPLQTPSGGQAVSIGAQSVTNLLISATMPVYVTSVVENSSPNLLEMTYSMALANIVPATSAFTVMVNSFVRTVNSVTLSGTKVQLILATDIVAGDIVTVAYTKPPVNPLQTTAAAEAASIGNQVVVNKVENRNYQPFYKINIYPNPYNPSAASVEPAISIEGENTTKPVIIRIIDFSGKLIYESLLNPGEMTKNIPYNYTTGFYLVQLSADGLIIGVGKFVVIN